MTVVVALRDVFLVHRGPERDVVALRGLDLELSAGEIVCIGGPSGAGKSSALAVIAGLRRPSAGLAEVLGVDMGRAPERARAELRQTRLGILRQPASDALSPALRAAALVELPLALRGLARAARRARAGETLEAVGLVARARSRARELSGGERLRLAIAQAIVHRPALLLADEPTGELDDRTAAEVLEVLLSVARATDMSVLLASHDPAVAATSDRTVRMRDGRVAEEEFRHRPPSLVVDTRGWVRLPASARTATRLRAEAGGHGVRLSPVGPARQPASSPPLELPAAEPVRLELRGVTRRLAGRMVLDGYDASLVPGRLTVVAGRSGTGKTTVLRLLAGLDLPDAGAVRVDGTTWSELDAEERAAWRRRRIGFLAQEPLPPVMLTAREVLELGAELRGSPTIAAEDLLESVGLGGLGAQQVERMSQGEVQRLALVRALAGAGGLLIVDEPTSRLDEAAAERVGELLGQAVAAGNTVVCATHDSRLLAIADERLDL